MTQLLGRALFSNFHRTLTVLSSHNVFCKYILETYLSILWISSVFHRVYILDLIKSILLIFPSWIMLLMLYIKTKHQTNLCKFSHVKFPTITFIVLYLSWCWENLCLRSKVCVYFFYYDYPFVPSPFVVDDWRLMDKRLKTKGFPDG